MLRGSKDPGPLAVWIATEDELDFLGMLRNLSYFPMQNVLKIKFRMSSEVVAPVIASSGRRAL
jgi:hypothetical protein